MAIIDVVSWDPGSESIYAWKYPHKNLSTYTQLIVSESQEAVLFSKGQIIGKFGPGKHTLNTENLPILRNFFGIPFGGKNPFTAEVWFVNKLLPLNIDWSTDGMMLHDPDYQTMVPLTSSGRYGLKVIDAERFLIKLVGTADSFTSKQLTDHFWGALVSKTKTMLLQFMQSQKIGIKSVSAYLDMLSENLKLTMRTFWEDFGFELVGFYLTTVEVDTNTDAGRRIMDAMSRQSAQAIGGYTWQQSQVFETADKAIGSMDGGGSGSQGGLLGAVIASSMMGNLAGSGLMQSQPTQGNNAVTVGAASMASNIQVKEVFCSNCAKKYSNSMKFCPFCGDPYLPCPKCGSDNDKNAKRCVSCGNQMSQGAEAQCDGCHAGIPSGAAFCPSCGKPASAPDNKWKRCGCMLNKSPFCPQCGLKNE